MAPDLATLRLEAAAVTGVIDDGDVTRHPESHFLDLVIDGRSLRSLAGTPGSSLVTEFNRPWLPGVSRAIDTMLGRRPAEDLAAGRIPLLVCARCGDLACGQLTAGLDVGKAAVSWSHFLWEDGMGDPRAVEGLPEEFTFDRAEYEAALADARARVAAFPYVELAHDGRRFLWPWQWGWKLPPRDVDTT